MASCHLSRWLWIVPGACAAPGALPPAQGSPGGSTQRTFTRAEGKQVAASIAGFDQGKAIISLANGTPAALGPKELSAEDRQWINDWRVRTLRSEAAFSKRRLEAKGLARAKSNSDTDSSGSRGSTSVKDESSRTREQSWCYGVTLINRSQTPSGPLRIESRQFGQRRGESDESSGRSINETVSVLPGQAALGELRRQATAVVTTQTQKLSSVTAYQKARRPDTQW